MGGDSDPVTERRRERAEGRRRRAAWWVAGLSLGAAAVGLVVLAYVAGRFYLGGPSAEVLASHPWFQGQVSAARVEAIVDAMEDGTRGRGSARVTVYFDSRGEFLAYPEYEPDPYKDVDEQWGLARQRHPEIWERLRGPVRRVMLLKGLGQPEPTRPAIRKAIEWALDADGGHLCQ